jgi:hypothetical protein
MSLTASQSFCLASNPGGGDFIYTSEDIHLTDTQVSITDGPPTPVSEPASLALLAGAAGVLAVIRGARQTTMPRWRARVMRSLAPGTAALAAAFLAVFASAAQAGPITTNSMV